MAPRKLNVLIYNGKLSIESWYMNSNDEQVQAAQKAPFVMPCTPFVVSSHQTTLSRQSTTELFLNSHGAPHVRSSSFQEVQIWDTAVFLTAKAMLALSSM